MQKFMAARRRKKKKKSKKLIYTLLQSSVYKNKQNATAKQSSQDVNKSNGPTLPFSHLFQGSAMCIRTRA